MQDPITTREWRSKTTWQKQQNQSQQMWTPTPSNFTWLLLLIYKKLRMANIDRQNKSMLFHSMAKGIELICVATFEQFCLTVCIVPWEFSKINYTECLGSINVWATRYHQETHNYENSPYAPCLGEGLVHPGNKHIRGQWLQTSINGSSWVVHTVRTTPHPLKKTS